MNPETKRADLYMRMYHSAVERYELVTDLVFRYLADGDVVGLLNAVGDIANENDYVDETTIAEFDLAMKRWSNEDGAS